MDALRHDLRYAFRHLRRAPGFAAAAILTLALGIGANTAMFTMLNTLMLKPLAIEDPHGLIALRSYTPPNQRRQILISAVTELERHGPLDLPCALNGNGVFAADVGGVPTQSVIALVTGRCFETFGVAPILGRTISEADAPMSGPGNMVAVIGHRFWTRMFGQDPNALGKTIKMEGRELTVIGVMPAGFVGIQADGGIDVWMPNYTITPRRNDRPAAATQVLGRLKPGVSLEQARAELTARWPALMEATVPATLAPLERDLFMKGQVRVERLATGESFLRDRFARPVTIVLGLTGVLLLLACINLGGLLLSRLAARGAEFGVRLALGGSRARIAQQMLIESLLLSAAGALLAIPASFALVAVLQSFLPTGLVNIHHDFRPDATVLAATAAIGMLSGALMSIVPIWLGSRRQGAVMFTWDRTIAGHTSRWTRGLLVAQIAIAVVLLAGAGLLARSLYLLQHANLGMKTDRVLNLRVLPLPGGYRGIDNATYYRALHDRLSAIPGVRSVGFARGFPRVMTDFAALGQPIAFVGEPSGDLRAQYESASPGFFETMGIPLLRGRYPTWADHASSAQVAIVSEALASRLAPAGDILGRHVRVGSNKTDQDVEIVGVVGNASMGNPRFVDVPVLYRPMLQVGLFGNYPNLVVATEGDPLVVAGALTDAIKAGGREYPHLIQTVDEVFLRAPSSERMTTTVSGATAVIAIALAFIGIYSVLTYSVARRTREIGVRVALGADRRHVLAMVMREGLIVTALGLAIGLPASVVASRLLRTMMFGITAADPAVLGFTALLLALVGVVAGAVPAARAANLDPAITLRAE